MQTAARRAPRRVASAGVAPRARSRSLIRARVPEVVGQKDSDGATTFVEVSQLVRDLCRQHDFDRAAWKRIVDASNSQADRLEALEHEMLQVNDDVAGILDGHVQSVRANELALQAQLKSAFEDMGVAIKAVERGLIESLDFVKQEFNAVTQGEKMLLSELRNKFAQEQAVLELQSHAQAHAAAPIRRQPAQHFDVYTPEPRRLGPGVAGGDAGAAGGGAG